MNPIPSSLRPSEFARELEGQMLRWGHDVMSPHGNLLERHGFRRFRTASHVGSSCYRLYWGDRVIELHSSCITFCGGGRPGLRYVRSRKRVYLCSTPEPPPPGDTSDDGLILPFRPDDMASFRAAADELRRWLQVYAAWRAHVPSILAKDSASASTVLRRFGSFRRWWARTFSRSPTVVRPTPKASGKVMPASSLFP